MKRLLDFLEKRSPDIIDRSISDCRYVVIDTELTGFNDKKDAIVSIGGIKMIGKRIELNKTFYDIVNPRSDLTRESVIIHGITPSEAKDGRSLETVIIEFLDFLGDDIIVGHFLSLDMRFINKELKHVLNRTVKNPMLDTWLIYDWIEKQYLKTVGYDEILSDEKNLYSLAKKYNLHVPELHNALSDAFVTAQLFQRLLIQLQAMGILTTKKLLKIGGW